MSTADPAAPAEPAPASPSPADADGDVPDACFHVLSQTGDSFDFSKLELELCATLANAARDADPDDDDGSYTIPASIVDTPTLKRVHDFCKETARAPAPPHAPGYDSLTRNELVALTNAACFLDCGDLLEVTTQRVASRITGMSRPQMAAYLGVTDDFAPDEREAVDREVEWLLSHVGDSRTSVRSWSAHGCPPPQPVSNK